MMGMIKRSVGYKAHNNYYFNCHILLVQLTAMTFNTVLQFGFHDFFYELQALESIQWVPTRYAELP